MKKKILSILLVAIIGIGGAAYSVSRKNEIKNTSKNQVAVSSNKNELSNDIKTSANPEIIDVKTNMDMKKLYKSIKELKDNSEIIVRGTVLETNSYVSGPGIITEYKLKVTKSYNDNAKNGDIVTIASSGGIVGYEEYIKVNGENQKDFEKKIPKESFKNTKIRMSIGESELIEKSREYIIFADTQQVSANKKMYCTLNVYQGQFSVDTTNNKLINKSLKYNNSIDKFEQEIQQN